jgi:hypothetical protein
VPNVGPQTSVTRSDGGHRREHVTAILERAAAELVVKLAPAQGGELVKDAGEGFVIENLVEADGDRRTPYCPRRRSSL